MTGSIRLRGNPIEAQPTDRIARSGVAHVPEGRGTFLELTVSENLRMGAYTRKDRDALGADFERIFEYFPQLKPRIAQQAGTLSGGEQQMLAVSRALLMKPVLLLLDEPSFGMAPQLVRSLFEVFRTINATEKVSMLLVEQNASLALELADHAYLLETGRVVMAGSAQDVRNDAAVRRSYLGY
jgi:branched-chain amino acid transport system ATP-binding protein